MTNSIRTIALIASILVSGAASADHTETRSSSELNRELLQTSSRVQTVIRQNLSEMTTREKERVISLLGQIEDIALGQSHPGPGPIRPPRPDQMRYEATCHIDDDSDFTYDQYVAGTVRGSNVAELFDECMALGRAMYANRAISTGIKNLSSTYSSRAYRSAECQIDDDRDFTANQFVIGTVVGESVQDMVNQCQYIAQSTFGSKGSSALRDIQ